MATFGIAMVRDESDVIATVVRHMADEVDEMIVADNNSTDGTRDLLEDLARDLPLTVLDDPDPGYHQSAKMSALASAASDQGADWIVPFDADEIWLAPDRLSVWLDGMDPAIRVAQATLYNHHPTAADPPGDNPFVTEVWRMAEPGAMPKVAFRYSPGVVVEMGNHGVVYPDGDTGPIGGGLTIRHFSHRSFDQFRRKVVNGAAAYAATDLPFSFGAHWRSYAQILDNGGDDALREVFETWFWHRSPVDDGLIHDPAPVCRWQTLAQQS